MLLYLYFLSDDVNKTILSLVVALFITTLLTSASAYGVILTPQSNLAKQKIITNQSLEVDHAWEKYDFMMGSVKGDDSNFTIYDIRGINDTMPPVTCGAGTHEENGQCIPDVVPPVDNETQPPEQNETQPPVINDTNPPPQTGEDTIIKTAGDFSGTGVLKLLNGDINVALGDLLYQSSLDTFINVYPKDESHKCVPGNHDQEEDGNSKIAKQSSQHCGDIWFKKVAGGTTVLIGANTNGNLDVLLGSAQQYVMNSTLMQGVKNVMLFTHKQCHTNTGAHHNVEGNVKTFCQSLEGKVPAGVKFFTIAGHEHNAEKNSNGLWFVAGTGGKSKYECGSTANGWSFCNDSDNGYLQITIDNDSGAVTTQFIKASGGVMS